MATKENSLVAAKTTEKYIKTSRKPDRPSKSEEITRINTNYKLVLCPCLCKSNQKVSEMSCKSSQMND